MKRAQAIAYRRKIESVAILQDDEHALQSIALFPKWREGIFVNAGERYKYEGKLYRVVQTHTTQSGWSPDIVPSLFTEVSLDEWPEWKQPLSSEDAYHVGDKVSHNDKHWESLIDGNVWEPGTIGSESLWKEV